jgi:uncharacterized protein (DUF1778 family)
MSENRLVIRINKIEKELLRNNAKKYGFSLTDYVKRKLLDENEDLADPQEKYISPARDKSELLTVSLLYKTIYMVRSVLRQHGLENKDLIDVEQKALEFAREQRERYGYKIIKEEDDE